jgi:steroid 5-alpha reductase family enzyme
VIENPWILLLMGTLAVVAVMLLLWLLSLRNDNFSYVDIGWSINFAVIGVLYAALAPGDPLRRWLFAGMFSVHGLRLGWHLSKRIIGQPEEGRYVQLRKVWGRSGSLKLKFLAFFEFQAVLKAFLTLPMLIA